MLPPSHRSFVADSLDVYENDLQFGVTADDILLKTPPMRRDADLGSLYFGMAMGECLQHFSPQPLEWHASHLASSARKPGRRRYHEYVHSRPTRRFGDVANTMTSFVDLHNTGYLSRKHFLDATESVRASVRHQNILQRYRYRRQDFLLPPISNICFGTCSSELRTIPLGM